MKILDSPFGWYHLTTLTPNLRYHYCETTNFEELISNSNIQLADDIVSDKRPQQSHFPMVCTNGVTWLRLYVN